MIEISNLVKRYGSFPAVNDLSLKVNAGEIFSFLGVNGAGKTTTLKMLAGILKPTSGNIKICGYDIQKEAEKAKRITGFIPDHPYLYAGLTGREFMLFVSDLYETNNHSTKQRIEQLLDDYQLTAWQNELIENYSHGMKQRLATCAAILPNPKVLIIDEPMVGLDPHGAKLLKEHLCSYARNGMTVFLSTHSLNVAEEISDRIAIIHGGKLIAQGSLSELHSSMEQTLSLEDRRNLENLFLQLTSASDEG